MIWIDVVLGEVCHMRCMVIEMDLCVGMVDTLARWGDVEDWLV